jgi:hypothetical protein
VTLGVWLGVKVRVAVKVALGVKVRVRVGVRVALGVRVGLMVKVGLAVRVKVGVQVGGSVGSRRVGVPKAGGVSSVACKAALVPAARASCNACSSA